MLGKTRQYLGEHLHHLFGEGELAFQFSLFRHSTYGGMSNFFIKSDDRFQEFAATARADPSSRLTIAITMKDPRKIIKQNDVLESGNLELELMYAPEKQKVIKAKRQARLAVNPKADLDAVHENSRVEELASNILAKYGCNAETMRIKDPLDPKKSIAIHSQALRAWSRAWVAGVPGVDINTPPRTRQFEPEDIRVYTLAEEAVRRGGRRVPKSPDPFDLSVNKTPAAQGPKFGPVRTSSGGRVMPNKSQGPQSAPAKTVARADTTPPNNGANRHSRTASPPVDFLFSDDLPETRPSSPEEERSEAVDELSTTAAGDSDIDDEDGQSAGDRRSGPDGRTTSLGDTSVSSTVERTARRESSEIEVWAARMNDKGVHCSPARKLMRSPLDSSIASHLVDLARLAVCLRSLQLVSDLGATGPATNWWEARPQNLRGALVISHRSWLHRSLTNHHSMTSAWR
ncbi:hypothetical protein Pst134EB_027371 [Puccinia striiformis f. sp. tritici]|nr:hypothetical protein Pst134EB_027371 [Puccinia striiformis f. sp. tritici]